MHITFRKSLIKIGDATEILVSGFHSCEKYQSLVTFLTVGKMVIYPHIHTTSGRKWKKLTN